MVRKKKSTLEHNSEILNADADTIIQQLTEKYGEGTIFHGGMASESYNKGVISTGIFSLDQALGVGGLPIGRVIEYYGVEAGGKTSLALKVAVDAMRQGYVLFFIDLEHALDRTLASNIGVDVDSPYFCITQPDFGDQAMEIIEAILESKIKSLIIVDSISALLPKEEYEAGFLDPVQPGRQANLMSRSLRKLTPMVSKTDSMIIFVNQLRSTIGPFASTVTSGGKALKFYASIRLSVNMKDKIDQNGITIGHSAKVKVVKNKVAAPYHETVLDIFYGSGFSSMSDMLRIAVMNNIVVKSGAWYAYKEEKIGQGMVNTLQFFLKNPDTYKTIVQETLTFFGLDSSNMEKYRDKTINFGNTLVTTDQSSPENENEVSTEEGEGE
jgi:recombination protein RecA